MKIFGSTWGTIPSSNYNILHCLCHWKPKICKVGKNIGDYIDQLTESKMFVTTRVISEKPPVPKRNIGLPQVTTRDLSPASFVFQYLVFHQSPLSCLLLLISFFLVMIFFKWNVKLDQVYCAWLIKWVVKREIIQLVELRLTR